MLQQESEFIQQVFTEPLLCARHYFRCWEYIPLIKNIQKSLSSLCLHSRGRIPDNEHNK